MGGLTVVPQSPSKACTLPLRVSSPSPPTCRRLHSPGTVRRHKLIVDGGNADLDVWKTITHDHGDLSALPVWPDNNLPPTPTWQRCSCAAGPPPCSTTSPGRVRRGLPLASPKTPTSFSTFKPSPATSPGSGVETVCPSTLRPERCSEQTACGQPKCHSMSLHLHVKHAPQCPANSSNRSEQSTA